MCSADSTDCFSKPNLEISSQKRILFRLLRSLSFPQKEKCTFHKNKVDSFDFHADQVRLTIFILVTKISINWINNIFDDPILENACVSAVPAFMASWKNKRFQMKCANFKTITQSSYSCYSPKIPRSPLQEPKFTLVYGCLWLCIFLLFLIHTYCSLVFHVSRWFTLIFVLLNVKVLFRNIWILASKFVTVALVRNSGNTTLCFALVR